MGSAHVIGLDIGTTAVRAAELEFGGSRSGQSATLVRYGEVPLPTGAVRDGEVVEQQTVGTALRQLWQQQKFSTKDVVVGVGNQRVVVRELELPWAPLTQLKASLPFQVQEMLPVSVDDTLLDYLPTDEVDGPSGRMVRGLLIAAPRDTVTANLLAVEAAGLRPTMVDLNGFALVRALHRAGNTGRIAAYVEVGARVTTVVVAQGTTPRLVRVLPMGGQQITDAIARTLAVSQPEAEQAKRELGLEGHGPVQSAVTEVTRGLVEAVRNTFVYYQANHPGRGIEVVVLSGGGAHLPGFGQYISSASRLPAVLGDALAGITIGKGVPSGRMQGLESLVALPTGLAHGVAA
ncbi:type IV pilus assembly protein PilM [Cellulomonas sp. NPDC089187]|uniref:type IV pilus assembly protein PilM n=1 Tax=Cellulomonas sp. NPDC089187 TaxID=3154970 RepID=UPI0034231BD1